MAATRACRNGATTATQQQHPLTVTRDHWPQWYARLVCHPTCRPRKVLNALYEDWHCFPPTALDPTGLNVTRPSNVCAINMVGREVRRHLQQTRDTCVASRTCPSTPSLAHSCECSSSVSPAKTSQQPWSVGNRCLENFSHLAYTLVPKLRKAKVARRIVYFCSASDGWGAFLKSLLAAFAFSVLTERALVLYCRESVTSLVAQGAHELTSHIEHYFTSEYLTGRKGKPAW